MAPLVSALLVTTIQLIYFVGDCHSPTLKEQMILKPRQRLSERVWVQGLDSNHPRIHKHTKTGAKPLRNLNYPYCKIYFFLFVINLLAPELFFFNFSTLCI